MWETFRLIPLNFQSLSSRCLAWAVFTIICWISLHVSSELASRTSAITPAAIGALALVPEWSDVHFLLMSVVINGWSDPGPELKIVFSRNLKLLNHRNERNIFKSFTWRCQVLYELMFLGKKCKRGFGLYFLKKEIFWPSWHVPKLSENYSLFKVTTPNFFFASTTGWIINILALFSINSLFWK